MSKARFLAFSLNQLLGITPKCYLCALSFPLASHAAPQKGLVALIPFPKVPLLTICPTPGRGETVAMSDLYFHTPSFLSSHLVHSPYVLVFLH